MKLVWRPIIRRLTAAVMALAGASLAPGVAGQATIDRDVSPGLPRADTGKPAVVPPATLGPDRQDGCAPPLPCGTRLLGTIRKNGAVELQVPAMRW